MCIKTTSLDVKIADKDIEIYKVVKERISYYGRFPKYLVNPFKTTKGRQSWQNLDESQLTLSFEVKAYRFNKGYGYCCFYSLKFAKEYITAVRRSRGTIGSKLKIVKLRIPKGARYAKGSIAFGYIGAGLPGIRAEQIKPLGEKLQEEDVVF